MTDNNKLLRYLVLKLQSLLWMRVMNCDSGDVRYLTREELLHHLKKIHARRKLQARKMGR